MIYPRWSSMTGIRSIWWRRKA